MLFNWNFAPPSQTSPSQSYSLQNMWHICFGNFSAVTYVLVLVSILSIVILLRFELLLRRCHMCRLLSIWKRQQYVLNFYNKPLFVMITFFNLLNYQLFFICFFSIVSFMWSTSLFSLSFLCSFSSTVSITSCYIFILLSWLTNSGQNPNMWLPRTVLRWIAPQCSPVRVLSWRVIVRFACAICHLTTFIQITSFFLNNQFLFSNARYYVARPNFKASWHTEAKVICFEMYAMYYNLLSFHLQNNAGWKVWLSTV